MMSELTEITHYINEEVKLKLKTVLIRPEVDFGDIWEHVRTC